MPEKSSRSSSCKTDDFLCQNSSGQGRRLGKAQLKVTTLSCFSSRFYLFLLFLEKSVFSFLFSCISFKHVSLLASVSQFNHRCFLRSRCSMEMWCPDDIGRDSWDWVWSPTWRERACFTSPDRVEWRLLACFKTEPLQIVVVVVDVFRRDVFVNKPLISIGRPGPQLRRGGRKMPH